MKAGQKDGPHGSWDIRYFETFEEAFAFMLGYQKHVDGDFPMHLLGTVAQAVMAYRLDTYQFPSFYYVPEGIEPVEGVRPPPDEVHWVPGSEPLNPPPSFFGSPQGTAHPRSTPTPSTPVRGFNTARHSDSVDTSSEPTTPRRRPAPVAGATPNTDRFESLNLGPDPTSPHRQPNPTTRQHSCDQASNCSASQGGIVSEGLTPEMRMYLRIHHRLSAEAIAEVEQTVTQVSVFPRQRAAEMTKPCLTGLGMKSDATAFFVNWVFSITEEDESYNE
jgi:hypothetical protein